MITTQNYYELYHYGVLGMKWGIRKNPSRAYTKAVRKKAKLEDRALDARTKAAKAARKSRSFLRSDEQRDYQSDKATKLNLKSAKLEKKAHKIQKAMDKVFAEYSIERLPAATVASGKKYVEQYKLTKVG